MQGIPLVVLSFAVIYLCHKLLSFVKALQAIQYANTNSLMDANSFFTWYLYPQVLPRETYSLIIVSSKCHSTENVGNYCWAELFIHRKT